MRNVLPLESKRNIKREYRARFGIVALALVFALCIIGIVSLLPSLFLSEAQSTATKQRAELVQESISLRQQDASVQELNEANAKLAVLAKESKQLSLSDVTTLVIKSKSAGVTLTGFFFSETTGGEKVLTVKGRAERRDNLLAFQEQLEDESAFSAVRLPVSSLAKDRDVEFSLELIGNF